MKRLSTRREYHDSQLTNAAWLRERDLRLTFRLDGNWNGNTSIEASVTFSGVRNREGVDETLRAFAQAAVGRDWLADVVAIVRNADRSYLVDTSQGSLVIDAAGFSEI